MPRKPTSTPSPAAPASATHRPSALLDTRVIYCGDNLDQLGKLPEDCVDLVYIDPPARPKPLRRGEGPPFDPNRNDEVSRGALAEPRASASEFAEPFEDRHASMQAYIGRVRARDEPLAQSRREPGSIGRHTAAIRLCIH